MSFRDEFDTLSEAYQQVLTESKYTGPAIIGYQNKKLTIRPTGEGGSKAIVVIPLSTSQLSDIGKGVSISVEKINIQS